MNNYFNKILVDDKKKANELVKSGVVKMLPSGEEYLVIDDGEPIKETITETVPGEPVLA